MTSNVAADPALSDIPPVLKDTVSVITGASSGIGKACAQSILARQGSVALVDINQERLSDTVAELGESVGTSEQILTLIKNVRDEADMQSMAAQTLERFGRIDHLIASAGILRLGSIKTVADTPLSEWEAVIQTNLTGVFLSNQAVLPAMMDQKQGEIINISSVSGLQGRAFDAAYCASKFGIIGFSESLAAEVAAFGIRVQTVLPDSVDTPFWEQNDSKSIKAPVTIPAERVAELIVHLITLPRDAFILNPVIGPFKTRKKRSKS